MHSDVNTRERTLDDASGHYGALVNAEGREIPITAEMILQACRRMEPYSLSSPFQIQGFHYALLRD